MSACFYLYLSGATRRVVGNNRLGVHRTYFDPQYFGTLTPQEARKKQNDLEQAIELVLQENGVPRHLRDRIQRTSSRDVYWLSEEDVVALGVYPAWYEERVGLADIEECAEHTEISVATRVGFAERVG